MRKEIEIRKIIREYGRNRKLRRITLFFCAAVACVTAYVLINPANTMTAETYCGYEEHVHDETCYALKPATPSKAGKGTPSEATPSDYYVPDHSHPVCGLPVHEHTLQCYSDPEADTETEAVWERMLENIELTGNFNEDVLTVAETQLGYPESKRNYEVQEDGETMRGYTRYGAWYGDMYGKWDAMFCAFCLHYAGVPEELMPFDPSCAEWTELLKLPEYDLYREADAYTPVPGDIVFLGTDHVGFVRELIYDEETEALTGIRTIEGIPGDCVSGDNTYDITDTAILGYSRLPKNPAFQRTIESAPAADGAVAVITGELPDGAEAHIEAVALSDEQLEAYFGKAQAAWMKGYAAYDIKITVDGEEWEPDDTVSVTVRQNTLIAEEDQSFGVAHVDGDTEEVSELNGAIADDGEITFHTDGFSLYIFYTFTVDFHFGDLTFSIAGMDSILFSELFRALGIELDTAEVSDVSFSDPTLLKIEQTADGDWLLTSLAPFTTNETLTVTFKDGKVLVISVTDATVGPCSEYLKTTGKNSWQIVVNGYQGNDSVSYRVASVDADGDGYPDARVQKNVVPTDTENEFYVYLSISRPLTFEELFRTCNIGIANNNNGGGFGGFSSTRPGGYKGHVEGEVPEGTPGAVYAQIDLYEDSHLVGSGNSAYWVGDGDLVGSFIGWRGCPGNVSCSNGSIYLEFPLNGVTNYLKLANQTTLKTSDMTGQGNPFHPIISLRMLQQAGVRFSLHSTALDSVTDVIGDNIEYIESVYCDGSIEPTRDAAGNVVSFEWTPVEKEGVKTIMTNPLHGTVDNVAELVYKVRLKTEADGFNSCAGNMQSAVGDPESNAVNKSATLDYSLTGLTGGVPTYSYNGAETTVDFQKPYVRGLLYDLWFKKVADDAAHTPLSGAQFKLILADGSVLKDEAGNERIFTSDENGLVGLSDLPQGDVSGVVGVEETAAPPFYKLPDNPHWDIVRNYTAAADKTVFTPDTLHQKPGNMRYTSLSGSSTADWQIVNEKAPGQKVAFKKVDLDSTPQGHPLSGVTFALYGAKADGSMEEDPISGFGGMISDNNGVFSPPDFQLEYGKTYYLKELSTRAGFEPLTEPVRIEVAESGVTVTGGGSPVVTESGGVYTMTVGNGRISPDDPVKPDPVTPPGYDDEVTIGKKIDYLGDNRDEDGNPVPGTEELYRLYLELDAKGQPADVLLVLDRSSSMLRNLAGRTAQSEAERRSEILRRFLVGTGTDDGFIREFLSANEQNTLSVVTFGDYATVVSDWTGAGGAETIISAVRSVTPTGNTNYTDALRVADIQWDKKEGSTNRKVMIFLSDGVPTITNIDGSIDGTKPYDVGTGSENNAGISSFASQYLMNINYDAVAVNADPGLGRDYIDNRTIYADTVQFGLSDHGHGYPCLYSVGNMVFSDIPGMEDGYYGAFTDSNAQTFLNFYQQWNTYSAAVKAQWIEEHLITAGSYRDIFYLSEQSYRNFAFEHTDATGNPDVETYTIGFASDFSGVTTEMPTLDNGTRYIGEVLKYMSGDMDENGNPKKTSECERFFYCGSAESLADTINSIALLADVKITDKLSGYVELTDTPELEITLKNAAYESFYETGKDYACLYENGAFTALGEALLDTAATKLDSGTLDVVFKPETGFDSDMRVEASFNVRLTEKAYGDRKTYGETYNGTIGDAGTDYGDNKTSSGKYGFYSNDNDNAKAEWKRGGISGSENFKKPVVQVYYTDIQLKKVDSQNVETVLSGAVFDLYREIKEAEYEIITDPAKKKEYTDAEGTVRYLKKINTESLVSGGSGTVTVKELHLGQYYLFETKAPDGYRLFEEPLPFEVRWSIDAQDAVSYVIKLPDGTQAAFVDADNALLLNVKNQSGYELPHTGGIGASLFLLPGLMLLAGGAALFALFMKKILPEQAETARKIGEMFLLLCYILNRVNK